MAESPYDFRSALSGEPGPLVEEEGEEAQAELLSTLTTQTNSSSGSGGAPLNLNLANGLLVMGNSSGSLEVDTTDQRVVIDPESPSEVGRRDGEVVLGTTDEATPLWTGRAVEGEALQPMVSSKLAPISEGVPASSATIPEGEVTEPQEDPVHVVSVQEPDPSDLGEDFSSTEGTPLAEAVSSEFTPMTESIPATEAVSVEESPDSADATGPVVTVDPETGETVILAEDLRITVGPENGQVRIEPSDENVPLAEDTAPITVDAGGMTMVIDPETGTLEVAPVEGESTDITVEVGDLRLVMDGETGEISVDPAEGSVSVDPETGLVTIEPTETEDGEGESESEENEGTTGGDEDVEDTGQDTADHEQSTDGQGDHSSGQEQGQGQEQEQEPGMPGTVPGGTGGIPQGGYGGGEPDEQVAGEKGESDGQGGDSEWSEVLAPSELPEPAEMSFLEPGPDPGQAPSEEQDEPTPDGGRPSGDGNDIAQGDGNGGEDGEEQVLSRLAPGPHTEPDPSEEQDEPTPSGGRPSGDEEDEEDSEDEKDKEDEEDGDGDDGDGEDGDGEDGDGEDGDGEDGDGDGEEKDDEDGDDKGDKGDGGEGGDGEDAKDKGTKIDLDRIAIFRDEFIIKVRDVLESQTPNFYDYSGGASSEGAAQVTRLGDPSLLEVAGVLGSRLDQSMAMLHSILIEFEEEFEGIQDRLHTNMNIFDDLESDQELTAGQVALIMDGSESASGGTPTP